MSRRSPLLEVSKTSARPRYGPGDLVVPGTTHCDGRCEELMQCGARAAGVELVLCLVKPRDQIAPIPDSSLGVEVDPHQARIDAHRLRVRLRIQVELREPPTVQRLQIGETAAPLAADLDAYARLGPQVLDEPCVQPRAPRSATACPPRSAPCKRNAARSPGPPPCRLQDDPPRRDAGREPQCHRVHGLPEQHRNGAAYAGGSVHGQLRWAFERCCGRKQARAAWVAAARVGGMYTPLYGSCQPWVLGAPPLSRPPG
jgi:hypothetical protein